MIRERIRIVVRGAVQGVGFRPFVYRLATELQLDGWVLNSAQGVFIEGEGRRDSLNRFLVRLEKERPPRAVIQSFESSFLETAITAGSRFARAQQAARRRRSFCRTSLPVPTVSARFSIPMIVAFVIPSRTAPIAVHVSPLSRCCPMIVPTHR